MLTPLRLTRHTPILLRAATHPAAGLTSLQTTWPAVCTSAVARKRFSKAAWRSQEVTHAAVDPDSATPSPVPPLAQPTHHNDLRAFAETLPMLCPGCGAFSQTVETESPGFYSPKKRNVRRGRPENKDEDRIFQEAVARLSESEAEEVAALAPTGALTGDELSETNKPVLCDRCHDLIYQSKGQSILHPSMESIRDIIQASPHRENHIYHLLDAADFPMSLIPNLVARLNLPRLRTQNRRSKATQYIKGRQADISFIITRSDLLAPQKETVDRMMPCLQEVLRDALGNTGKNLRLGNVRCVSAKRGWWTPKIKEEIWKRGGAGWVVGKVNVGKSALFEVVYPKGRTVSPREQQKLQQARQRSQAQMDAFGEVGGEDRRCVEDSWHSEGPSLESQDTVSSTAGIGDRMMEATESALETQKEISDEAFSDAAEPARSLDVEEQQDDSVGIDEDEDASLLPPAQKETQYPSMPVISSLPGTTAAPIRIPFGNGKGELIDLPGVMRSSMETHVKPEHHSSLLMKSRVVPEQFTLKPGQSLLLGGMIRITPKTKDLIFLAYPFTPLHAHVTSNYKATAIQTGFHDDGEAYTGTVESIATDRAKQRMRSAGTFKLEWDATKQRTGSLTDKTAGKQRVSDLPFIVYSADILVEGIGWVELACQVRSRKKSLISDAFTAELGLQEEADSPFPEVEVFTPKGKFIGVRRPLNAWITGGPKRVPKHAQRKRPRMSISYQKRMEGGRKGGQKASNVSE